MGFEPWLRLKSGSFSNWKTVNSVRDSSKFSEYKQINIFNQPTWYAHIMIKTPNDLINVLKDIYLYHLYYNSYEEKIQQLELYNATLENISIYWLDKLKRNFNLPPSKNIFESLTRFIKIKLWLIEVCNLMPKQIKKEIEYIQKKYLPARAKLTSKYWENLILNYQIYICLDEAPIYFWARSWDKNFSWDNEFLKEIIAYPVKLNLRIEPITQNTKLLDINFSRQASTNVLHENILLWLIQKTSIVDVKDPENLNMKEAEVISKSYRLNLYKIFWFPKVQYYRKHLIRPTDPDIYERGDLFKHIRDMTISKQLKEENKKNKSINTKIHEKNTIQAIT